MNINNFIWLKEMKSDAQENSLCFDEHYNAYYFTNNKWLKLKKFDIEEIERLKRIEELKTQRKEKLNNLHDK